MALAAVVMLGVLACAQIVFAAPERLRDNRVLALKIQHSISLGDLIQTTGYTISDEDVFLFLTDFIELNPSVKGVSALRKGTLVRIPLRHLKRSADISSETKQKTLHSGPKQRTVRSMTPVQPAETETTINDKLMILRNIERLYSSLGENVSIEREGFAYFSLSETSDLSFDRGLFPVMNIHNDRLIVIDYTGVFPDDIRNLLELSWPEYRVVSPPARSDLRGIINLLLKESGYLFQESSRMISGGAVQVEYYSDFLVHGKQGRPMTSDISLISVLGKKEYLTPDEIVSWFKRRDVQIIELAERDRKFSDRGPARVIDMQGNARGEAFVEDVLTLFGYPYSSDEKINLSERKEIHLNIHADLLVDMGHQRKAFVFSGVSDQEIKYAEKFGLDIAVIDPSEGRSEMLRKIMSVLSLSYTNSPKKNALSLTPGNARYHLHIPGFAVKSLKGVFLMTDAYLDKELQKSILNQGIGVVRF